MKKLLLAIALLLCGAVEANAAACFWVGGTGTWDTTNTGGGGTGGIKWASTTGGAVACTAISGPNVGVPGPSDNVTFDGSSGGGTVTVATNPSIINLTWGAFTGTLDWSVNNNTLNMSGAFNGSGTGTRTWKSGTGTITITNVASGQTPFTIQTTTGLTLAPTAGLFGNPVVFAAPTTVTQRITHWGGLTYTSVSFQDVGVVQSTINDTGTVFTTLAITGPEVLAFGTSITITNEIAWSGTAGTPVLVESSVIGTTETLTMSSSGSPTLSWISLRDIAISNASATFTFNNTMKYGNATCTGGCTLTLNPPSAGSGTSQIIGGGL